MGRFGGHWGMWQDRNTPKDVVNTIYTGVRPGYRATLQAPQGQMDAGFGLAAQYTHVRTLGGQLSADAQTVGQKATDQLNDAFARHKLQEQYVDGFQLKSATQDGADIKVEVSVSLNHGKAAQVLSFSLSPSSDRGHYSAVWFRQGADGYQFNAQSLYRLRAEVNDVYVPDHAPRGQLSAPAQTVGQTATDQLNQAFAGKQLDRQHVDGFQLKSATQDGVDIKVEVSVSLNGGKDAQVLSFTLKPGSVAGHYSAMDFWQGKDGYQFSGQALYALRSEVNDVYVPDHAPRGQLSAPAQTVGQTATDQLNQAFAGGQLQGQYVDGFRLKSATQDGVDIKVEVSVSLNHGKDAQVLSFTLKPGSVAGHYSAMDFWQGKDGYQFNGDSLYRLREAVNDVYVPNHAPHATWAADAAFASLAQGAR
jgi:hypothetical protein